MHGGGRGRRGRSTGDEEREKDRNETPGWGEECRRGGRRESKRSDREGANDKRKNDEGGGKEEGTPMKEEVVEEDEGRSGG